MQTLEDEFDETTEALIDLLFTRLLHSDYCMVEGLISKLQEIFMKFNQID